MRGGAVLGARLAFVKTVLCRLNISIVVYSIYTDCHVRKKRDKPNCICTMLGAEPQKSKFQEKELNVHQDRH